MNHVLEIRVITGRAHHPLLKSLERIFPYASVGKLEAVDHSLSTPELLLDRGLIGAPSYASMKEGRRWHHEVARGGAIGLAESVRLALSLNPEVPLLLLEDDCVIKRGSALKERVESLLFFKDNFEMAVFGGYVGDRRGKSKEYIGWGEGVVGTYENIRSPFWFMHCVLYTPKGRRVVGGLIRPPLDMQIDSFLGYMAQLGKLRILCETGRSVVYQSKHFSSVQENKTCIFCSNVGTIRGLIGCTKVVLVLQILVFVYFFASHKKK